MKYTLVLLFPLFFLFSCKKEVSERKYSERGDLLKSMLKSKMSQKDYQLLDFSKIYATSIDSAELYVTRIGINNKHIAEDFVIVRMNGNNLFLEGGIFHLDIIKKRIENNFYSFDGSISVNSLDRGKLITTEFRDNRIISNKTDSIALTAMQGPPKPPPMPEPQPPIVFPYDEDLDPLVDFVQYLKSVGGNGPSISLGGGYYWPANPDASNQNWPDPKDPLFLSESYDGGPKIDFESFFKCFNLIPDANAKYSISLMVDIPVNNKPGALFDWQKQFPGHTFIQLVKSNETQRIVQNIGFYPGTSFKSLTFLSVGSKVVDDSGHEFNASMTIDLSADYFAGILGFASVIKKMSYDIARYNCTDFAVDVFNFARGGNPLIVPQIVLPNYVPGQIPTLSSTPQELYKLLQKIKSAGGPETDMISIYPNGKKAEWGHGPCD